VSEIFVAAWMAMSPFLFGHFPSDRARWWNDLVAAAAILLVSTLSLWPPLRRLHLVNVAVAAWLIGFGWLAGGHPAPPASQNEILTGLVLLLFAIVPNDASRPPRGWRRTD